jgi:hypothetical protein
MTMSNNDADENKSNINGALLGLLVAFFLGSAGYLANQLDKLQDAKQEHGERIAKLEAKMDACVDCSRTPVVKNKGGYEWTVFSSEGKDLSVEIDVLSKQFRWKCGKFGENDVVRENEVGGAISLRDIIRKYQPDEELQDAKKIVVIGTASSEGNLSSQEGLALARATTLRQIVDKSLEKNREVPVIGMTFGQYIADVNRARCTDATAEQRRILIVKITRESPGMSRDELGKSLIRRFQELADQRGFPIDIRDYSKYQRHEEMLIE